jgi:hypothetical protein
VPHGLVHLLDRAAEGDLGQPFLDGGLGDRDGDGGRNRPR